MSKWAPWYLYLAEGFGLGRLPLAPGTWGSLGALIAFVPMHVLLPDVVVGILVIVAILISFPVCDWASAYMGQWDPKNVVLDELAGQWLALWPALWVTHWPSIWWGYLAGFILFRLFDITKFIPANFFDNVEMSYAIVIDDLIAGAYANLVLTGFGIWYF